MQHVTVVWMHGSGVAARLRSIAVLVDNRFDPVTHPVHQNKYDWYQGGEPRSESRERAERAEREREKERSLSPSLGTDSRGGLLRAVQFHSLQGPGAEPTYLAAVDVFPTPSGSDDLRQLSAAAVYGE